VVNIDGSATNCKNRRISACLWTADSLDHYFEIAVHLHADDPQLLESLALVEERRGHLEAALEYYEIAARFDPPLPRVFQRLKELKRQRDERR
jgi:hypothetical protein